MMSLTITQYHYLVIISKLTQQLSEVRSIDVAVALGVTRATTSRMVKYLISQGWIVRERRSLKLTQKAQELLKENEKHLEVLLIYFSKMNLDNAEIITCVEVLSSQIQETTLNKICEYIKNHEN